MSESDQGAGFPIWAAAAIVALFGIPIVLHFFGLSTTAAPNGAVLPSVDVAFPQLPVTPPEVPDSGATPDLIAQQWMAWAALWTTLFTGTGVFLIWRTLIATHETLKQAEQATAAALETVAVTREVGDAQTSPFLMVMAGGKLWAQLKDGKVNCILKLSIKNAGHTATRGAAVTARIFPTQIGSIDSVNQAGQIHFSGVTNLGPMEPGGVFELDASFETTIGAVQACVRYNNPLVGSVGEVVFVVWVNMTWTDYAERGSNPQKIFLSTTTPLKLNLTTSGDLPLSYPKLRAAELPD